MKFKIAGISFLLLLFFAISTVSAQNLDSRSGDEAALEALAGSLEGLGAGWSTSGMSLSSSIDGVTVESIGGELRVTRIDLKNKGLTGNIEVPELGNLKEMTLFAVYLNRLNSKIPQELMDLTKLKYLYLSLSDKQDGVATQYPHQVAQTGGRDVHVGKTKGNEQNVFTGPVPAPSNPSAMSLEWFILNWTDSAVGATDGISAIPSELFDITTMVGLQIYNNNGVADLPFPSGVVNMSNIEIWKVGIEKAGKDTGFLTGTVPAGIGQLANLRIFDVSENPNLTVDFDQLDLSGMTSLRKIGTSSVRLRGNFPPSLLDGTLDANLVRITLMWPESGTGMSGTLPSGSTSMQVVLLNNNNLGGEIPAAFWDNVQMINTDFSYNNFTSIGTDDLTALGSKYWKIRNLRWNNNDISGRWPNLAWDQPNNNLESLSRVQFANNRYVFSDMLWVPSEHNPEGKTIFDLYNDFPLTTFTYSPQKPFGQSRTISYATGSDVTIDDFDGIVTHSDNRYQWQKDGSNISGATSRTLTIPNAGSADEGTYTLIVTNPGIPDLSLTSEPVEVVIN